MDNQADDLELAEVNFKVGRELMLERTCCEWAIPYLFEAVRIDKTNDHYYYVIAECYYFLKKYSKALTYIEEALQLNFSNCPALVLKSVISDEIGKKDLAKSILDEELAINKKETCERLFILANGRSIQHDFELAVLGFKKLMAIQEPDGISLGLIICTFAEGGIPDEGLLHCKRLLTLLPEDPFSYYCVGLCFEKKNAYEIALNWLEKAKVLGLPDIDREIYRVKDIYEKLLGRKYGG